MRPTLRPYQSDAIRRITESWRTVRRVMLQLDTGGGKTVIMADIAARAVAAGRHATIVVHRDYLVEQTVAKLQAHGMRVGVIAAGIRKDTRSDVDVAMIATLARREQSPTDVLMIDEAHRSAAPSYSELIKSHKGWLVGFTATPERLDGKGFDDLYDHLIVGPTKMELIEMGALVPSTVYEAPMDREGLKSIATQGGDYANKPLADYMKRAVLYGDVVQAYRDHANGKKIACFAASVELSQAYAQAYRDAGIPAVHVDGKTPTADRNAAMRAFRNGEVRVLCNVAIATEGLDVPDCDGVQILRVTKSLVLWRQMVGRASRTSPGKTEAIVLDHGLCWRNPSLGHPDVSVDWQLEGKRKRGEPSSPVERVDVEIEGYDDEPEARKGPDHVKGVRLVRVDSPITHFPPELSTHMNTVQRNNLRGPDGRPAWSWAWQMYTQQAKPSRDVVRAFARHAGFGEAWVASELVNIKTRGLFAA